MAILSKRNIVAIAAMLIAISFSACEPTARNANQSTQATVQEPTIEASPTSQGEGQWLVTSAESVTLAVNAPGAQSARILYRPVAANRVVALKKINAPTDQASGKFSAQVKVVPDFAGDVWAEVSYANGTKKETKPISLTAEDAAAGAADLATNAAHGDESERSDKFTGGKIETASFAENQPDIKITVDVPAFRLTLWQNGKEVKTYEIGVGRKEFPLVIGMRQAKQVIWNPEWVPPDSEWVEDSHADVEPGERIEADDPRNPLGKVKIPLGDAFLIHQAAKPSDIGHLVSHGCVRMLKEDLFDLAEKIAAARGWPVSKQQIEKAKNDKDRLVAKLNPPLLVDINYDTQVVEGGVLHIYPDVYGRNTNTVENLRAELQSVGADASKLDDKTLKQMLDRANANEAFVVNVADLKTGDALVAGKNEPLTSQSIAQKQPAKNKPAKSKAQSGGRGRR
ncbi:MAG TPA: L,D-transpeptidase [Blastocatellia bacterium]|nr:L,D-transpeptidase [Blastocatellia bacterium]